VDLTGCERDDGVLGGYWAAYMLLVSGNSYFTREMAAYRAFVESRILVSDEAWYDMEVRSSALDALLRASICLCDIQLCHEKQRRPVDDSTAENWVTVNVR
jgi:hypothetical protein